MALAFLPSLQHVAAVKVALSVYNEDIIHFLGEFIDIKYVFEDGHTFSMNMCQKERIRERKIEIRKKLSTFLPKLLVDRIVHVLQPIFFEVHYWVRDHFHILQHIQKSHITSNLFWRSEGTIDRTKTAKRLIQNESIDKRVRFVLASVYFWEQDVLQLWQSMKAEERENVSRIESNLAVDFWIVWLRKNAASPWTQLIPEYLRLEPQELQITDVNNRNWRLRISSFYSALNTSDKRAFFYSLWPDHAHADDLRICYYLTDETERSEMFYNSSIFFGVKDVLCFYLDWPLQSHFLDMVNHLWDHLTTKCLECCLLFIVRKKLKNMEDFHYLKLFKELWHRIPNSHKEQFKKRGLSSVMFETVLTSDENISTALLREKLQEGCGLVRRNFAD